MLEASGKLNSSEFAYRKMTERCLPCFPKKIQ
jgi:hypothetical protein